MSIVEIRREDISSSVAASLILALNTELESLYPEEGALHFRLDADEVQEGRGAFLVAYLNGQPVGCGAVRHVGGLRAEVKRMYVVPEARCKKIGKGILDALEREARQLGVEEMVLETGVRQPRALSLYQNAGFVRVPLFGEYVGKPLSVCMAKSLKQATA
jgi:putative acetyltransferase